MDNKGVSSFLALIVSLVILIPVGFVVFLIITSGTGKLVSVSQSVAGYVSAMLGAVSVGNAVIVPPVAPSLQGGTFMAQFYGSSSCMQYIDQLSRAAILSEPLNPSNLTGQYFICIGSINVNQIAVTQKEWDYLSPSGSGYASFPYWFPNAGQLNSNSGTAGGLAGSDGTLSYYVNVANPSTLLSDSCVYFFDADTAQYGTGTPSAYITSLSCVPMTSQKSSLFVSVDTSTCQSSGTCGSNPFTFLYGDPGTITTQICQYGGGNSLVCQFYLK